MPNPVVFTPKLLAERWQVSVFSVYDLLRAGKLRGFHVGKPGSKRPAIRIALVEVERFERGETAAEPPRKRQRARRQANGHVIKFF